MAVLHESMVVARGARGNAVSLCSPSSIGITIGITFIVTLLSSKLVFHLFFLVLRKCMWVLIWLKYREEDRAEDTQDDCEKGIVVDSTCTYHAHSSGGSGSHSPDSSQRGRTHLPNTTQTFPHATVSAQGLGYVATTLHAGSLHTQSQEACVLQDDGSSSNSPEATTQQATPPQARSGQAAPPQITSLQAKSSQYAWPQTNLPQALVRLLPPLETSDRKAIQYVPSEPVAVRQDTTYGTSRLEKRPFDDSLKRFNSTSKNALVQELTRPQHSITTAAPVQVEYGGNNFQNNGTFGAFVNPFDVEHDSYSIVFPAPGYNSSPAAQFATQSETPIVSPYGPYYASWNAPIEVGVRESQFDPSNSPSGWVVNSIPHEWNLRQGHDRGSPNENHDLSRHVQESPRGEDVSSATTGGQRDKEGQAGAGRSMSSDECQSPFTDESQITPRAFIFGQTEPQTTQLVLQASNGYQNTSLSDTSPMDMTVHHAEWNSPDVLSTQLMAESLYQERRFPKKCRKTSTDSTIDFLPQASFTESNIAWQDITQSPDHNHYAPPSYQNLHRLDTAQTIDWLLNGPAISSTETSPETRGSIFSARTMSTASISTASLESLRNQTDAQTSWIREGQSPKQMYMESVPTDVHDQCPSCDMTFNRPGKLSAHYNSVHCRRFPCSNCSRAFGLKHDLHRHKHTVHKDIYGPLDTFTCIKDGCTKKFHRKDHFRRHVRNCST